MMRFAVTVCGALLISLTGSFSQAQTTPDRVALGYCSDVRLGQDGGTSSEIAVIYKTENGYQVSMNVPIPESRDRKTVTKEVSKVGVVQLADYDIHRSNEDEGVTFWLDIPKGKTALKGARLGVSNEVQGVFTLWCVDVNED